MIIHNDALHALKNFPDNSIDSCVTDPPYGLAFMGKKWDYNVPSVELWREVYRVLKPGAHALIACGTRTQHRMVCNIEDAGFEIRDVISWVYGSGFPKSLNIGKNTCGTSEWKGWGTALKPAVEFFTLVRKPISEKNIAENVLRWGTGGINIDGCRVGNEERTQFSGKATNGAVYNDFPQYNAHWQTVSGRFPANFIHDGSEEVTALFPETHGAGNKKDMNKNHDYNASSYKISSSNNPNYHNNNGGSAARFFYCAKASPSERNEGLEDMPLGKPRANFHPTVKPLALMQYLIRLITPPDGVVLDCFAGSGTTGVAAVKERKKYILIEREEEYIKIIEVRVKHAENKIEPTLFDE